MSHSLNDDVGNVARGFVLGLVTFLGVGGDLVRFVGVGACGSFTTLSTFSFETVRLWGSSDRIRALANATATLVGAVAAIGLAWLIVQALP